MEKKIALLPVIFMVVCVCSSAALALPPMGPPKAILGENQWAIGFGYAHQEMDLELFGKTREDLGAGWLPWDYTKYKIEDLTSNMFLGSLGYGVCENWDTFVYAGAAGNKDEITETLASGSSGNQYYGASSDYEAAWGFGTRVTFCQDGNLTWGGLFQMVWSSVDSSNLKLRGDPVFSGDLELDFWEIQIAAGPTLQLDGFSIYGGPFLHFVKGDMSLEGTTVNMGTTQRVMSNADIREESNFGAYVGAQWDIDENTSWYAEGQFTGDALGFGAGVVWKF